MTTNIEFGSGVELPAPKQSWTTLESGKYLFKSCSAFYCVRQNVQ